MRRTFLVVLLLCTLSSAVSAQGFRSFSQRNHPELTWLTAETPRFVIVYPRHLAGIEAHAAAIAEASYAALSENLGVEFDRRIRIYLSDEDEITNGFAVPIGEGFTNIWVHLNDVAEGWTGPEKWLRKVIAHELAHIFHFRAVQSELGLLQNMVANPLPRAWTEGLAQYLTEDWDAQRGDRWLRTAVLDNRLSYTDGASIWNGRLMYAIGNSQARFFAEQYGDSLLAALHAHRRPALLGLFRVHDFGTAFQSTTGESYRAFYDRWRRHVNVYYNTLAGQLETVDSLNVPARGLPGQYVYDVAFGADTTTTTVLALESLERPLMRLYDVGSRRHVVLAEGPIRLPISISPDNRHVAFARMTRGGYGSLVNDLYVVDRTTGREHRLTRDRRAAAPAYHPEGQALAYVAAEGATSNVFELSLSTGQERRLTEFEGDVQIGALAWHPSGDRLAMARFRDDGGRDIAVLDLTTGVVQSVTDGTHDDRDPRWSPDGRMLAYTSFRDHVPNVFVLDVESGVHRRVTRLVTGARVREWLPPDSTFEAGRLVVISNVTKERDRVYVIDAARTVPDADPVIPEAYASWTTHRPPEEVPTVVPPDEALVLRRGRYNSWQNITHAVTLPLPYFFGRNDWGIAVSTVFVEPLGKHAVALSGVLNAGDIEGSAFGVSYVNNHLRPTLALSAYRGPGTVAHYGDAILHERFTGGEILISQPLDVRHRPFTDTRIGLRLRYVDIDPLGFDPEDLRQGLPMPEPGRLADVRLEFIRQTQRPFRYNIIHPLDGHGLRLRIDGAARVLRSDSRFAEADLSGYVVLPSIGRQRLYVYGRLRGRNGVARPQDFIGFSRYDDPQVLAAEFATIEFGTRERVRGFNRFAVGDRLAFGVAEYRVPLTRDLYTRVLGVVSLGATSFALFADAGAVWTGADIDAGDHRLGSGAEVKNALRFGPLEVSHAVGVAGPMTGDVAWNDGREVYYRVRAAVPFR
jgi:Tol biopolymer transport system component